MNISEIAANICICMCHSCFPTLLVPLELPRKTAFLWHSQACINRDCRCHKQFPARWVRLKYVTGTFYKKEHKVTPTIYLNWNSFFFHRLCLRLLRRGYQIISMQIFVVCNQIGITQGEKVWNIGDSFNVANSCQSKVGPGCQYIGLPEPPSPVYNVELQNNVCVRQVRIEFCGKL